MTPYSRMITAVAFMAPLGLAAQTDGEGELKDPVRLKAGGTFIDTAQFVGHNGPHVVDINRDGRKDLLVGTFSRRILVFENEGSDKAPKLVDKGALKAAGQTVTIPNW